MREDASASVQPDASIEVDDVDAAHAAAQRLGCKIVHPLTDEPWGVAASLFVIPTARCSTSSATCDRDRVVRECSQLGAARTNSKAMALNATRSGTRSLPVRRRRHRPSSETGSKSPVGAGDIGADRESLDKLEGRAALSARG